MQLGLPTTRIYLKLVCCWVAFREGRYVTIAHRHGDKTDKSSP